MLLEYSVKKPLNREPPIRDLVSAFVTKASTAYDRNHGPLPHIDDATHAVRINGAVEKAVELSVHALRTRFPQHEVTAALQCAGNRRHTMRTELKEVNGIDWKDGACCNCIWRGPLLADVLAVVGITLSGEGHVCFDCLKTGAQDDDYYGASVPLSRCLDPTKRAILALEMNGSPLPVSHGFPVRAVIPGIAGARWTKWLDRITISEHESPNYYQQRDYKILPPDIETKAQAAEAWCKFPAIQGMPINSVIAYPEAGSTISGKDLTNGELEICGYALPQGDDGPVVKVEVSSDKGETWTETDIIYPSKAELGTPEGADKYRWAWAIWKCKLPKDKMRKITKDTVIWSRARDAGGNMQSGKRPWNYRGVAYNAYGETKRLQIEGVNQLTNGVRHLKI